MSNCLKLIFVTVLQAACFSCLAQGHKGWHRLWGPTGETPPGFNKGEDNPSEAVVPSGRLRQKREV